jgi:hypothetical protein
MKNEFLESLKKDEPKLWNIVSNWYLSIPEIFQDDDGNDLEEISDTSGLEDFHYVGDVIKELRLSYSETLELVLHWYNDVYDGEKSIKNEDGMSLFTFCDSLLNSWKNLNEKNEIKNSIEILDLKIYDLENIVFDKSLSEINSFEERILALETRIIYLEKQINDLEIDFSNGSENI